MKLQVDFAFEESSYINNIPGRITIDYGEGQESITYSFVLMEKIEPLKGDNRYKVKWDGAMPDDSEMIGKKIIKTYKEMESE